MKIYLGDNKLLKDIDIQKNQKVSSYEEADIVIYNNDLESLFAEIKKLKNKCSFLPVSTQRLTPISLDNIQTELSFKFEDQSVGEVSEIVEKLVRKITKQDTFEDQARYLINIAVELIQNSLIFKRVQKLEGVIELVLKEDKNYFSIEVQDFFGGLTKEIFLKNVKRAYSEKTPENKEFGAGLGFFTVLNLSNELQINIERGKKTKICSIIKKYKRLKDYKNKHISIHIEEKEELVK